jgi:hypothetical protein
VGGVGAHEAVHVGGIRQRLETVVLDRDQVALADARGSSAVGEVEPLPHPCLAEARTDRTMIVHGASLRIRHAVRHA